MFTITVDDLEEVYDESSFMEFLIDILKLPISEDLTLEDITSENTDFTLGFRELDFKQVLDCQELCITQDESSGIILIRFNSEIGYIGVLQTVAKDLDQQTISLTDYRFFCTDEDLQPFAFAYFKDSDSDGRHDPELNILSWTHDNTRINISSEHEIPQDLFLDQPIEGSKFVSEDVATSDEEDDTDKRDMIPETRQTKKHVQPTKTESKTDRKVTVSKITPDDLLEKLQKTATPLGDTDLKVNKGVITGCNKAYVIEPEKRQELIDEDPKCADIIKLAVGKHQANLWKPALKYIIWMSSSKSTEWEWTDAKNETQAKKIFAQTYPAISKHLKGFEDDLKGRHASCKGKFSWELSHREHKSEFNGPKITFYDKPPVVAYYDESDAIVVSPFVHCIPTTDFSILAMLNSKFAEWFVRNKFEKKGGGRINKDKMKDFPIADITKKQQTELSNIVAQILDDHENPTVPDLEEEINQLVYELYDLTPAEIKLIEEETNQ